MNCLFLYADDILLFKPITCKLDFAILQNDINLLVSCVTSQFLTLNTTKCKL